MNNFDCLIAIMSGLNNSSVQRLKEDWKEVKEKFRNTLSDSENLMSASYNFRNYRNQLKTLKNRPCIPYIALHLKDIFYVIDSNQKVIQKENSNLIDFAVMKQTGDLVHKFLCFQSYKYDLHCESEMYSYFSKPFFFEQEELTSKSIEYKPVTNSKLQSSILNDRKILFNRKITKNQTEIPSPVPSSSGTTSKPVSKTVKTPNFVKIAFPSEKKPLDKIMEEEENEENETNQKSEKEENNNIFLSKKDHSRITENFKKFLSPRHKTTQILRTKEKQDSKEKKRLSLFQNVNELNTEQKKGLKVQRRSKSVNFSKDISVLCNEVEYFEVLKKDAEENETEIHPFVYSPPLKRNSETEKKRTFSLRRSSFTQIKNFFKKKINKKHSSVPSTLSPESPMTSQRNFKDIVIAKEIEEKVNIHCINFDPFNTNRFVCCGNQEENNLRLWEIKNSELIENFNIHSKNVSYASFHPVFKNVVISSSFDGSIKLTNTENGNVETVLKGHHGPVTCFDVNPQNHFELTSGSSDKLLFIWDTKESKICKILKSHSSGVHCVRYNPHDNTEIASGASDNNIIIWDLVNACKKNKLKGHKAAVTSIVFTPDSQNNLLSSSLDSTAILWNFKKSEKILKFSFHVGPIMHLSFVPSFPNQFVTVGQDKYILFWDISSVDPVFKRFTPSPLECITFLPNHDFHFVTVHSDNKILFWKYED